MVKQKINAFKERSRKTRMTWGPFSQEIADKKDKREKKNSKNKKAS